MHSMIPHRWAQGGGPATTDRTSRLGGVTDLHRPDPSALCVPSNAIQRSASMLGALALDAIERNAPAQPPRQRKKSTV
jgi:hypothetical protein